MEMSGLLLPNNSLGTLTSPSIKYPYSKRQQGRSKVQNDALRYCKGIHLLDKISIEKIHNSVKLLSLEQRRQKQLLNIMFIQSIKGKSRAVINVNTRSQAKYVFKVDTNMGTKYKKLPYYLGTILSDYGMG